MRSSHALTPRRSVACNPAWLVAINQLARSNQTRAVAPLGYCMIVLLHLFSSSPPSYFFFFFRAPEFLLTLLAVALRFAAIGPSCKWLW